MQRNAFLHDRRDLCIGLMRVQGVNWSEKSGNCPGIILWFGNVRDIYFDLAIRRKLIFSPLQRASSAMRTQNKQKQTPSNNATRPGHPCALSNSPSTRLPRLPTDYALARDSEKLEPIIRRKIRNRFPPRQPALRARQVIIHFTRLP